MLSTNEQIELEILLSIEEPTPPQQTRIEYLLGKKGSEENIKSFEPVDIGFMECKCLNCFLRTIPEHSKNDVLIPEIARYFEYKNKNKKSISYNNPVVTSMYETVLKEANIFQVANNLGKDHSDIVTIDNVIDKYRENKLSESEVKEILSNSEFIKGVYEVCLFIIQKGIEVAEKYNLRSLIAIQTYYMTIDLMFSVVDQLDYEPSWDLVNLIHANMANELKVMSNLANLVSDEHLHSNCKPSSKDLLDVLKGILDEN